MIWYAWALVGMCALSVILSIAKIGKPREPVTNFDAVVILVINSLIIWAIVTLATKS